MTSRIADPGLLRRLRGAMQRHLPLLVTCRDVEMSLDDYLADDIDRRQRRRLELHLRLCRECRSYLEAYRRSIALGRAVLSDLEHALPDGPAEELVQAVLRARDAS